jgi:hypothetical protein
MKNFARLSLALTLASLLASCANIEQFIASRKPAPELDYLDRGVKMDIKNFFNGDIESFAITQDQNGKISGTSTSKINSKWEENKGVMQEIFFDDKSKKDSRTWLITSNQDGTFDMVGHDMLTPVKGKQIGNAAQMIYSLSINAEGVKQEVKFEDKVYLVDEKSAVMISNFRKQNGQSGRVIRSLKKISN